MADYKGFGKAKKPMLPSIGVPTTAGTGSEAQSYALIADEKSHLKMACGDRKAAFRIAILDPELTVTQPAKVTALTGIDALSHAIESYVTTRRNPLSQMFAREAWRLLEANLEKVLHRPDRSRSPRRHADGRLLGRHRHRKLDARRLPRLRQSADRPLRHHARPGHRHDAAARDPLQRPPVPALYGELVEEAGLQNGHGSGAAETLAERITSLMKLGGAADELSACGVSPGICPVLAEEASQQWTARFNPAPGDGGGNLGTLSRRDVVRSKSN